MMRKYLLLITLSIAGTIIWQSNPEYQEARIKSSPMKSPVVHDPSSPVVYNNGEYVHQRDIIDPPVESVNALMENDERYTPVIIHNPVIPVKSVYTPLSKEEKAIYIKNRDRSEKNIQQAMAKYNQYLDDPVKRAKIQSSIKANSEEYKQAMIKLARQAMNEQSGQ